MGLFVHSMFLLVVCIFRMNIFVSSVVLGSTEGAIRNRIAQRLNLNVNLETKILVNV